LILFAGKNVGNALLPADPSGRMNSRQEGSSLTVFDFCLATVIVMPRECLVCLYSSPYVTST